MNPLNQFRAYIDANGKPTMAVVCSNYVNVRFLSAGAAETETVPIGANVVQISSDSDVYVSFNGSPAFIPATDITDGSAPVLNPGARMLDSGTKALSLVSAESATVTLEYWK